MILNSKIQYKYQSVVEFYKATKRFIIQFFIHLNKNNLFLYFHYLNERSKTAIKLSFYFYLYV